jgi:hypothetical protein
MPSAGAMGRRTCQKRYPRGPGGTLCTRTPKCRNRGRNEVRLFAPSRYRARRFCSGPRCAPDPSGNRRRRRRPSRYAVGTRCNDRRSISTVRRSPPRATHRSSNGQSGHRKSIIFFDVVATIGVSFEIAKVDWVARARQGSDGGQGPLGCNGGSGPGRRPRVPARACGDVQHGKDGPERSLVLKPQCASA